jgi:cholesterol transport system auxiliary component
MKTTLRFLCLACCLALGSSLAGCAVLDPGPPAARILLDPELPAPGTAAPLPLQIAVVEPSADDILATDRIAAVFNGFEVRYVAGARWAAPVPRLLQRFLIDALEHTGRFAGVGDGGGGMRSDIRLLCDIRRFGLRYRGGEPPVAEVSLLLRLMEVKTGRILATLPLSGQERITTDDLGHQVLAFTAIMGELLARSGAWAVETLEGAPAPDPTSDSR